jgi:hypothetical protein
MQATPLQNELNNKGREQGPDFILTIDPAQILVPGPANAAVNDVISSDSGISEILNIIAFLVNPAVQRVAGTIDGDKSIPPGTAGTQHDANFDVAGGGDLTAQNAGSLFGAAGVNFPLINLDDFMGPAAGVAQPQIIPQGILKRRGGAPIPGYDFTIGCPPHGNRILTGVAGVGAPNAGTTNLLSNCVKQMINILIKVRDIFGPQGWTALFSQVKSGGGKNHAKRTHRQHRRKYSSKHY